MCKTCIDGICSNGCMAQTQVSKVVKITPHPVPGAVGDESDRQPESINEMFDRIIVKGEEVKA